jgi:hypothetical protein
MGTYEKMELDAARDSEEAKRPSDDFLFPQEMIMQIQRDRQVVPLQEQFELFSIWREDEKEQLNKMLLADTFTSPAQRMEKWEQARFYPGGGEFGPAPDIRSQWADLVGEMSPHGLQISRVVLRSKPPISLRALACDLKLAFRLRGSSTLWIITRGSGIRDPDAVICKISKEAESQRVFLIFGAAVGPQNSFKFFKRQEIPEMEDVSEEALQNDSLELKLDFIDNGDDKVFVQSRGNTHIVKGPPNRDLNMTCNQYIPCTRLTQVMLAGDGDSVELKHVSIKQVERVAMVQASARHVECCQML